jgi:hypothetical protein
VLDACYDTRDPAERFPCYQGEISYGTIIYDATYFALDTNEQNAADTQRRFDYWKVF